MTELKLCPFCGGDAEITKSVVTQGMWGHYQYQVICTECGAQTLNDNSEEIAVRSWNRRAEAKDK